MTLLCASIVALWSSPVLAHLTPNSEINLVIGADAVTADIIVPEGEYAYATGNPVGEHPEATDRAQQYLREHFHVSAPDGRRWTARLERVEFVQVAGPPDLHAVARLIPPPGSSLRRFNVVWSVLLDELPTHFALFVLAGDEGGMIGKGREILGAVRSNNKTLEVDRGASNVGIAFANAMLLGMDHIIGGYDHLLFLLALLMPAPMIARAGRWRDPRPIRSTLLQLARIVTAFTIGHSLTLISATLDNWRLPAAPVEVGIAISVLVSAIHAIRPLLPGREPFVALVFGLVHGLAFATLLHQAGAGTASTLITLLGFNLGIEAVQLALVSLVIPPLLILSRQPGFAQLRAAGGFFSAVAAVAWIANRTLDIGDRLVGGIEALVGQGLWAIAALYVVALGQIVAARARRRSDGNSAPFYG